MATEDGATLHAALLEKYEEEGFIANLRIASVAKSGVSSLATPTLPKLVELDVSGNALPDLADAFGALTTATPLLHTLNLAHNPLRGEVKEPPAGATLARLRTLVLDGTGVTWGGLGGLGAWAPGLVELSVGGCGLETLEPPDLPALVILQAPRNRISSWEGVMPCGGLPLHTLVLSDNPLVNVGPPGDSFTALRTLWLSNTAIADFVSVRSVGALPALVDVRLKGVPVFDGLPADEARLLCISLLPNLPSGAGLQTVGSETCGKLNGSAVSRFERRDAEAFAERYHSGEWEAFKASSGLPQGADLDTMAKALSRLG